MNTGGCQCGKVRYQFTGEPINQMFCYCSECQHRTGGDKWFGIWVQTANFEFVGELKPSFHTRKGSTGKDVHHYFCPECGVNVCADITAGSFYTVAAPTLDEPESFKPNMAIFAASAPTWAVLPTDIPVYEKFPPM
ncbi:GFA family protein [Vibrio ishigakensis]|uniref:GFA family protein n=1 Tax=Vibrio ishigakensis TaxID=1481914 RepID=UPI0021C45AA0|nr:GFA family protein [Vibrio ishigakensis]